LLAGTTLFETYARQSPLIFEEFSPFWYFCILSILFFKIVLLQSLRKGKKHWQTTENSMWPTFVGFENSKRKEK